MFADAGRSRAGQPRGALAAEPLGDAARHASRTACRRSTACRPTCSARRCRRRASSTSRARPGSARNSIAGGTIVDDFDGDGLLDVVLTSASTTARRLRLFRNRGDGTFEDRTEAAGLAAQLGGLNAIHDRLRQRRRPRPLHPSRRLGDRRCATRSCATTATASSPTSPRRPASPSGVFATHSAAWADYDNDGWLDLFVGHELTPSRLFRNRGDGTFEDVVGEGRRRPATPSPRASTWGDYDNDGFPDLYVSNMFGDNFLYRNNGDGTFDGRGARSSACSSRSPASRPGSSTTTTTAGSTCSWSRIPNSVEEFVKHYLGQPPAAETLTLYRNDGRRRRSPTSRRRWASRASCRPWAPTSATSTTTASSTSTSAPARRRSASLMPEHHAPERRRPALPRRHRGHRHRPPAEGPRRRLRRPRQRRRPGRRAERRRRRARRPLRRRAVREPGHAGRALDLAAAGRRQARTAPRIGAKIRVTLAAEGAARDGSPRALSATARCRAAARSAPTRSRSTSAWAGRRRIESLEITGR